MIDREVELLADAQVTLLADRRETRPWGLAGGKAGEPGVTHGIRMRRDSAFHPACLRQFQTWNAAE